jgi:predicted secreted hydrolase
MRMENAKLKTQNAKPCWERRRAIQGFVFCVLSFAFMEIAVGADDGYKQAVGPREWSFPRDHGRHDGFQIEWWYFTGNLTDKAGRRFGYQLTFFRSLMSPEKVQRASAWGTNEVYFAHAAIADVADHQFLYRDVLSRGRTGLASASDQTMDVVLKNWSAALVDGHAQLKAATDDFSMALSCAEEKPVFQGVGGLSQKGPSVGQASYYYSMPRMETTGTLVVKGKRYAVSGLTWMDHEFSSNVLSPEQVGWDWISVQLADGRALMLYRLRNKDGTDTRFGSLMAADGSMKYLAASEIEMRGSDAAAAPSGAKYPQRWTVKVPGVNGGEPFEVRALMANCELRTEESTKVTYYEGPMDVVGKGGAALGEGYLEMTGYAGE